MVSVTAPFHVAFGRVPPYGETRIAPSAALLPLRESNHKAAISRPDPGSPWPQLHDDIGGFRLPFAIRAAIIAVFLGVAVATRMGALLLGFHTLRVAFRVPELFGRSGIYRRPA